jgi:hypothetical protein
MSTYRWEDAATVTFAAMNGVLNLWKDAGPNTQRFMTRLLYDAVFCSGEPNKTGYISSAALLNKRKRKRVTSDHCLSPQFVARMIYDNPDRWLTDLEEFKKLFYMCCTTITVTPEENVALSKLTENRDGKFTVLVPTHKKYEYLNISLLHKNRGVVSDVFEDLVPRELIEYEKQYLVA